MNFGRLASPGLSFTGTPAQDGTPAAPGRITGQLLGRTKRGLTSLLSPDDAARQGHTGLAGALTGGGGNALLNFGLGLLAQDGWSTTPGAPLGARLGKAGAYAIQQQHDDEDRDYKRSSEASKATLDRLRLAMELDKAHRPSTTTVGHDLLSIDPDTNEPTVLYRGQPDPTSRERDFQTWKAMPDGPEKDRFGQMLAGYRFTDDGEASRIRTAGAIAEVQGVARDRHRAPARGAPKYAAGPNGQVMKWVP